MKKTIYMDKYPVYSHEISKEKTGFKNVNEILAYFKEQIDAHPVAAFISLFDHFTHTTNLKGDINPQILDAKNIVFCFGSALPDTSMLAARPRSIGVAELKNSFMIEFIEAPNEKPQKIIESWIETLDSL